MKDFKIGGIGFEYEIELSKKKNIFKISGRYLPGNSKDFFAGVTEWFTEYKLQPNVNTVIQFRLDYFNTSTSKKFLDILTMMEEVKNQGKEVIVEWYYVKDDVDLLEAGKGYAELVDIKFRYIIEKN